MNTKKKKRSFLANLETRHQYNKRSGLYKFALQNLIKLIIVIGVIVGLLYLLNYLFDLEKFIKDFIFSHSPLVVFAVFLVSESILGWIPPDLFIVWAKQFSNPFLVITFLATISYGGGIIAYYIGKLMLSFPKLNAYIHSKNKSTFDRIKKWGGGIIIFAAIFPLPFATTATIAGMVKYSFKKFLIYGLSRYIRFYLYTSIIFKFLETIL